MKESPLVTESVYSLEPGVAMDLALDPASFLPGNLGTPVSSLFIPAQRSDSAPLTMEKHVDRISGRVVFPDGEEDINALIYHPSNGVMKVLKDWLGIKQKARVFVTHVEVNGDL